MRGAEEMGVAPPRFRSTRCHFFRFVGKVSPLRSKPSRRGTISSCDCAPRTLFRKHATRRQRPVRKNAGTARGRNACPLDRKLAEANNFTSRTCVFSHKVGGQETHRRLRVWRSCPRPV